jgi:group I intron endonuclease
VTQAEVAYIYLITNNTNGKVYVGSTVELEKRWKMYRRHCHNSHLKRAILKDGIDNFEFEVITTVGVDSREPAETFYISAYNACDPAQGYNKLAEGTKGGRWSEARKAAAAGRPSLRKGVKASLETRIRMSQALRGKPKSAEHNRKNSEGVTRARAAKKWASRGNTGKRHSEDTKRRIAETMRQVWIRRKELKNAC